MNRHKEADRLKRLNDKIESSKEKFQGIIHDSGLVERRKEAMESNSDYQRKQRLGADGRMHEAVEKLARNIHERNHYGEAVPSFTQAQKMAAESAERVSKKLEK